MPMDRYKILKAKDHRFIFWLKTKGLLKKTKKLNLIQGLIHKKDIFLFPKKIINVKGNS